MSSAPVERMDWSATLQALSARARAEPGGDAGRELLGARHAAFLEAAHHAGRAPLSHASASVPVDPRVGLPVVHGTPSAEQVRSAIDGHGSLFVRGLISAARARELREMVQTALAARATAFSGREPDPTWHLEFEPVADPGARAFTAETGSMFAADSPRGHFQMVETLRESGIIDVSTRVLGSRPAVSVEKCVLRSVGPDVYASWHQDGAFLGERITTLDVWIALSRCGRTAPGLEIVPRRVGGLLTTGAFFDWDIADETVTREYPGVSSVKPEFEEGDALIFDQLCVHRTGYVPGMTETRYALECWLFAAGSVPANYTGLLL